MAKEKTKEQIAAEDAAKKAAAKVEADKKDAIAKKEQDDAKQKEQAAINDATAGYTVTTTALQAARTIIGSLTETSTIEDVKTAQAAVSEQVKLAKEGLKAVKAAGRKVKESGALKQAVADTEGLVSTLESEAKTLKDKLDAAKKAQAEQEKAARETKREADKKEREAEKARKKAEREAKKEPEQNGIRKPSVGTLCRAAWDIFDAVSTSLGTTAPISYVLPTAIDKGLNEANVKAEYARWKKYHGISGRVAVPVPESIAKAVASVTIPSTDGAKAE